jgi:uncharacterized membrane protein
MSQFPPPPPYGAPTPQPYGAPQPAWDLGTAIGWAWAKFQQNLVMMAGAAIFVVGLGVVDVVGQIVIGGLTNSNQLVCDSSGYPCHLTGGTSFIVSLLLSLILAVVITLLAQILMAGLVRGALRVTNGGQFELSDLLPMDKLANILVTSLIVAGATFVGFIFCIVPGIIVGFLLSYSMYFVMDKDMAPMDAVRASWELTTKNLGSTVVWYIVGGLIAVAGLIACLIGVIATIPIYLLGTAYTYKKLTGQEVVA